MSGTTGQVRIWWDPQVQAYRCVTTYNQEFVTLLKQLIPASDRVWNQDAKQWIFTERVIDGIRQLAEKCFHTKAVFISRAESEKAGASTAASVSGNPIDSLIVEWFKMLPYECARKAYIAGAMALHPDKGGSLDVMTNFNAMWQRLEREHFKRD